MQSTMTFLIFLSILLFSPNNIKCQARDTITANDPLFDDGRTVVSAGKIFELGFFSPGGNSNRYVGIWYYQRAPRTCVWIANRDKALVSLSGIVAIDDEDGANLKVLDTDGKTYFSTDQSSATLNSSAKLLDSGNLVFIDHRTGIHLWQSFENPTDTFLPGMEMNGELNLTSWLTHDNPATGFEPRYPDNWEAGDFTSGCQTKSAPCSTTTETNTFLNLTSMKVGEPDAPLPRADTEAKCSKACLEDCECRAYSFLGNNSRRGRQNDGSGCWTWTSELNNLQEKFNGDGRNLSVRVALTEIGTKRDCKPCGATVIPYPLSIRTNCGDPMYNSFS